MCPVRSVTYVSGRSNHLSRIVKTSLGGQKAIYRVWKQRTRRGTPELHLIEICLRECQPQYTPANLA
jgi:hypothetical protein